MSKGFRFRIFTPARSNDFVVLKVSDDILPSKRNVFGAFGAEDVLLVSEEDFESFFVFVVDWAAVEVVFGCLLPEDATDAVSDPFKEPLEA